MKTLAIGTHALLVVAWFGLALPHGSTALEPQTSQKAAAPAAKSAKPAPTAATAAALDQLLAPIALYPDALLAQMLLSASNPGKVAALAEWLASQTLKGTELQDAATKSGFEPSLVALVLFPQVVNAMAGDLAWTTRLGEAFTADRSAVFDSIQRLRGKARDAGKLKSTPQQDVETKTTSSGQQVIVIEPANPQVVYVPQYNPQTVYTTSSTVVVQQESSDRRCGRSGGDWVHRGDRHRRGDGQQLLLRSLRLARRGLHVQRRVGRLLRQPRGCARGLAGPPRGSRGRARRSRGQRAGTAYRTDSSSARRPSRRVSRRIRRRRLSATRSARKLRRQPGEGRRHEPGGPRDHPPDDPTARERSGTKSDAFSGYSSGKSERASSQRGQRSRSSSRGGGGRRR